MFVCWKTSGTDNNGYGGPQTFQEERMYPPTIFHVMSDSKLPLRDGCMGPLKIINE